MTVVWPRWSGDENENHQVPFCHGDLSHRVSSLRDCGRKGKAEGVNKQNISAKSDQIHCYQSPGYFVVAKEVEGRAGTDFLIKYKATTDEKPACAYVFGTNDFEIKNEWAKYFAGLKDNLLLSIAPQVQGRVVSSSGIWRSVRRFMKDTGRTQAKLTTTRLPIGQRLDSDR